MVIMIAALAAAGEPEAPKKVDLGALFRDAPAEGVRRCRSKKPAVATVSRGYVGGAPPMLGTELQRTRLFIDGFEVQTTRTVEGAPAESPAFTVEITSSEPLNRPTVMGEVSRRREHVVVTRSDGAPVRKSDTRLEFDWVCEFVLYPPRP